MTSRAVQEFLPIERVLGPARSRYFGAGYRDVRYSISPAGSEKDALETATVSYPQRWSVDGEGRPRSPHLSSIDAIALSLMFLEARLTGSANDLLRHTYVTAIDLRAESRPWLLLDGIPLSLTPLETPTGIRVQGRVGNIRVAIDLATAPGIAHEPGGRSVYGSLFQTTECDSFVDGGTAGMKINGVHRMQYSPDAAPPSGVESDWWPGATMIDYFVALGQITQALVYQAAGVSRGAAGALWMRTMQIRRPRPPLLRCGEFTSTAEIMRDRLLDRAGTRVHDVEVVAETSTDVTAHSTVAYWEAGL